MLRKKKTMPFFFFVCFSFIAKMPSSSDKSVAAAATKLFSVDAAVASVTCNKGCRLLFGVDVRSLRDMIGSRSMAQTVATKTLKTGLTSGVPKSASIVRRWPQQFDHKCSYWKCIGTAAPLDLLGTQSDSLQGFVFPCDLRMILIIRWRNLQAT